MRVSDDRVAALQAYLSGDFDRYEQLSQQLDRDSAWNGYMALLDCDG